MEEISEEGKKALWERERSQPCSWKLGMEKHIQQKKMSELALKGKKKGYFVSLSSLWDWKKNKSIWGKSNSVFIVAMACIGGDYHQHASRTSNKKILLLMTEMKTEPPSLSILFGLQAAVKKIKEKVMKYKQSRIAKAIGMPKSWSYKKGGNEISSECALFFRPTSLLPCTKIYRTVKGSVSVIGPSFISLCRSMRIRQLVARGRVVGAKTVEGKSQKTW